jgi:hypothetical protein
MNKPFNISKYQFSQVNFASDFHYNHDREFLWGARGFKSVVDHDAFIAQQCASLPHDSLLVYLGDFSLNSSFEKTMSLFKRINCTLFYVFGNHESIPYRIYNDSLKDFANHSSIDLCHSQIFPFSVDKNNLQGRPGIDIRQNVINFFGEECYFSIQNYFFFCRHMAPFIFDKMKHENFVSVCGHSHGNCKQINPETTDFNKILDVGVENAMKQNGTAFFSLPEVISIMEKKTINIPDHHGKTE